VCGEQARDQSGDPVPGGQFDKVAPVHADVVEGAGRAAECGGQSPVAGLAAGQQSDEASATSSAEPCDGFSADDSLPKGELKTALRP